MDTPVPKEAHFPLIRGPEWSLFWGPSRKRPCGAWPTTPLAISQQLGRTFNFILLFLLTFLGLDRELTIPALLLTWHAVLQRAPSTPTLAGIRTCVRGPTPQRILPCQFAGTISSKEPQTRGVGVDMEVYSLWVLKGTSLRPGAAGLVPLVHTPLLGLKMALFCLRMVFLLCTSVSWSPLFIRTPVRSYRITATLVTPFNLDYFFKGLSPHMVILRS